MKTITVLVLTSAACAGAAPLLQVVPSDGYSEAYEYVSDGHDIVAVGSGFCIVRYDSAETAPLKAVGAIELGSANRDIYIVESYLGKEWRDVPGTETLARFGDSYVVIVKPHLLASNWAGQFEIRKVFDRPIQPPDVTQEYPPIEESPLVREMVDRLYARDYGYYLESLVNVTPSRLAFNPMIDRAADYLEREFDSFELSTQSDIFPIDFAPLLNKYLDIYWYDGQTGWIIAGDGFAWKTEDSGNVWDDDPVYGWTHDIHLITPEKGIIVGAYGMATTENGGLTWLKLETDNYGDVQFSIDFFDEYAGATCGRIIIDAETWYGNCFITRDGGLTWTQTEVPEADWLNSICYRTLDEIWVGGRDSDIYRSIDGGQSFVEIETTGIPPWRDINYIKMFNANDGVIAGDNGLLAYTEDGGETWTQTTSGNMDFAEACFLNSNRGWVCGENGSVNYTEDGGRNWVDRNIPDFIDLYSVSAKPDGEVWVCGEDDYIAFSDDTGLTWQNVDLSFPLQPKNTGENIIGELKGTVRPEEVYIICAHYDSDSDMAWYLAPGAEDNASGTAGVLHLAEIMSQYDFASTIRFCCWSAEELGLLGSEHYAAKANQWGYDIRAVYNMDMISYMDDENYDTTINYNTPSAYLLTACQEASDIYVPELTLYPDDGSFGSDHRSFWDYGYPAVMAIEYAETLDDFYPWIHTTNDTYDHLRYDYGVLNVKLGAALIGFLAEPLSGPNFTTADVYAYPNPIRPDTDYITFANVPKNSEIEIFTITGDKVATVHERNLEARWNLCNDAGGEVASGVYLYYLDTGTDTKIGKIAVLH